jgi:tetratricopeptide (TPR) repeat protein
MTPELRQKREIVHLVQSLVSQYQFKEEVMAQIRGGPFVSAPMRQQALTLVKDWPEPAPLSLNDGSWAVVRKPKAEAARYRRALGWAEEACRRQPGTGAYLTTRGVAQYRNGEYVQALASLRQAEPLNAQRYQGPFPADLAFLAMAYHQLGQEAEAAKDLDRLRTLMRNLPWAEHPESQDFLKEAEALIEGKTPDGKMPDANP